jgi:hypothetical protein
LDRFDTLDVVDVRMVSQIAWRVPVAPPELGEKALGLLARIHDDGHPLLGVRHQVAVSPRTAR